MGYFSIEPQAASLLRATQVLTVHGQTNGNDITNWLGPLVSDYYNPASNTTYGAHAGAPSITASEIRMAPCSGLAGYIKSATIVYNVSNATLAGEFHLFKFAYTDGNTTFPPTDLGTLATFTAGGSTTSSRVSTITRGPSATVAPGDTLLVLYKGTAAISANIFYHTAIQIKES